MSHLTRIILAVILTTLLALALVPMIRGAMEDAAAGLGARDGQTTDVQYTYNDGGK